MFFQKWLTTSFDFFSVREKVVRLGLTYTLIFDSKFEPIPELWENIVIFGCTVVVVVVVVVVQELTPSITIPLHVAHMSLGDPGILKIFLNL